MGWLEDTVCFPSTLVTPSRYCQMVTLDEREFWGVYRGDFVREPGWYWTGRERKMLGDAMLRAEGLIEAQMCVHLRRKWDAGEEAAWQGCPHELSWKRFIAGGIRATGVYAAAVAITYLGEYGLVAVTHGGVGSVSEVRVYYPGTEYPIEPSALVWGATTIQLQFPRHRLVKPDLMDPPYDDPMRRGVLWDDVSNFITTLTVAREYHDPSTQAEFIHSEGCVCGGTGCERCCTPACMVASNPRVGTVNVWPAVYSGGEWRRTYCLPWNPTAARCSYRSGLPSASQDLQEAVVRLAHSLMPTPPCPTGRDSHVQFWNRDREVRDVSLKEVLNCPWGNSVGAWFAWNIVSYHAENYGKGGGFLGG